MRFRRRARRDGVQLVRPLRRPVSGEPAVPDPTPTQPRPDSDSARVDLPADAEAATLGLGTDSGSSIYEAARATVDPELLRAIDAYLAGEDSALPATLPAPEPAAPDPESGDRRRSGDGG